MNPLHIAAQALPAWNIILLARAPVAVAIPDCSKLSEIVAATNSKVKAIISVIKTSKTHYFL